MRYPFVFAAAFIAAPALAQEVPEADEASLDEAEFDGEDIVVTGSRTPPGSVVGDITPEVVLSGRDIRAYAPATSASCWRS